MNAQIGVIGAGAWGTALAQSLAGDGSEVLLWAREPELVERINADRRNATYLPSAALAETVRATTDLAELAALPVLLAVVPAQFLGGVLAQLPALGFAGDLVLCAKGIEAGSGRLMAEVATGAVPGAEIGGAVKNVLAIACGVVDGLKLGQNARAALIARGYAEMLRFGLARGARAETLSGLCGLGDLVLTCSSTSSRNFSLGLALGQGLTAAEALSGKNSVAEGAATAPVLAEIARRDAIEMPIAEAVCRLLEGKAPAGDVVAQILARPLRAEQEPLS